MLKIASPQKENGFTPIANEIVDQFCKTKHRLSGDEWIILWIILRKTYGWNKPNDMISLSQFAEISGMKRQNIHRALKKLSSKKMIAVIKIDDRKPITYSLEKDYEKWSLSTVIKIDDRPVIKIDDKSVINFDTNLSSKLIHTKDTVQKTIKTIKERSALTSKTKYLDTVYLSRDEFLKLEKRFGVDGARERIEELNLGVMSKGYKYKSDYHAILVWDRRKRKEQTPPPERARGLTPDEMQEMH